MDESPDVMQSPFEILFYMKNEQANQIFRRNRQKSFFYLRLLREFLVSRDKLFLRRAQFSSKPVSEHQEKPEPQPL